LRQAAGASVAASVLAVPASSYARILGANDRINAVIMGVGGRGIVLLQDFVDDGNVSIVGLCDTDTRRVDEGQALLDSNGHSRAAGGSDIRRMLETAAADILVIATPDHWHAPAAILGLDAGLHVYVEKPISHNPGEGELLVAAQRRRGRIVQVGNQQRSSLETRELIRRVHAGEIGDIYRVHTWYANNRGTIGNGTKVPPPDWLDWELWQGPAPRRDYRDNVVHYNWHWFWDWGTGETCNNAMHELDIARWAIRADYPDEVRVSGSRRFFTDDDWEMYDTIVATFRFGDVDIVWEGNSCNRVLQFGRDRGVLLYGTNGSAIVDRNGYEVFGPDGSLRERVQAEAASETTGLGGGGPLNRLHIDDFLQFIRGIRSDQHSPVAEGHKSTLLCHLANIAYRTGETLRCDPVRGRPTARAARALWARDYEPGWEPPA